MEFERTITFTLKNDEIESMENALDYLLCKKTNIPFTNKEKIDFDMVNKMLLIIRRLDDTRS